MGSVETKLSGDDKLTVLAHTIWKGFPPLYKDKKWIDLAATDQAAVDEAYLTLENEVKNEPARFISIVQGTPAETLVQDILTPVVPEPLKRDILADGSQAGEAESRGQESEGLEDTGGTDGEAGDLLDLPDVGHGDSEPEADEEEVSEVRD